ncbi:M3 family metallopeptidase [Catellatospora sp. NPDC049133]|uniref:M3 family metallopeptidase n=1 Tax=Catellatospora sp. NPDC049133 TaxID=3155499 RepID=UPI0033F8DE03
MSALPVWNLDSALTSYGGSQQLMQQLTDDIALLSDLYERHQIKAGPALEGEPPTAVFDEVLSRTAKALELERVLLLYHAGRCWADGTDAEASTSYQLAQHRTAPLAALTARLRAWAARLPVDRLTAASTVAAEHAHWLRQCQSAVAHSLPDGQELLLSELAPTGHSAWQRLYEQMAATAAVAYEGELRPAAAIRADLNSPLPPRRSAAADALGRAWSSMAVPAAAALNALLGHESTVAAMKGWPDLLDQRLAQEGIEPAILTIANRAITDLLPHLDRFARTKAQLLGAESLAWQDIAAPLPNEGCMAWLEAVDLVAGAFTKTAPQLARLARAAARQRWVDAAPRPGKRGTALCLPMGDAESRIMVNFDGTADSVYSLAHEFGHAYHHQCQRGLDDLQRTSPLLLREAASMYAEHLLLSGAPATGSRRMHLLHAWLIGVYQTCVGGYARFLFEREATLRRHDRPLTITDLDEITLTAQQAVYGPAVDPDTLPAHIWISHSHLYTSRFNSWPYYCGLLLALGLLPSAPPGALERLLANTGTASPTALAAQLGADLSRADFWARGTRFIAAAVDEFESLATRHATPPKARSAAWAA